MTRNLGLAGAADYFGAQLSNSELASLESDLFTELASVRLFDDALESLNQLKNAGLKLALCSISQPHMRFQPNCYCRRSMFTDGALRLGQ